MEGESGLSQGQESREGGLQVLLPSVDPEDSVLGSAPTDLQDLLVAGVGGQLGKQATWKR